MKTPRPVAEKKIPPAPFGKGGPGGFFFFIIAVILFLTACSFDGVVIVTEWGIADLRELTVGGKALALAAISHPSARDELLRYVTDDPMFTKPVGFAPGRTPRGVTMYNGKIAIDEK